MKSEGVIGVVGMCVPTVVANLHFFCCFILSSCNLHRKKTKREEYRVKLHPSQRQVSLASLIISTLVFTLDTFTALPYLLFRQALHYKPVTLYS